MRLWALECEFGRMLQADIYCLAHLAVLDVFF